MSAITFAAIRPEKRSRLTVFFRYLLVIPHYITLILYGIGAMLAVVVAWFAILFTGKFPAGLHAFVGNTVRYISRVQSYQNLLVDQYPPFDLGEHPEYPVTMTIAPTIEGRNRLTVFFRSITLIPVIIVNYVLTLVGGLMGILLWFAGVFAASAPAGLWNIACFSQSYTSRASGYSLLLNDEWPAISDDAPAAAPIAATGFDAPSAAAPPPPPPPPAAGTTPPPPPPPAAGNPFGE